ncbi:hypothetical protein L209DRAFT_139318 [Thermothelomyces heterothallicus CBS 203.75]
MYGLCAYSTAQYSPAQPECALRRCRTTGEPLAAAAVRSIRLHRHLYPYLVGRQRRTRQPAVRFANFGVGETRKWPTAYELCTFFFLFFFYFFFFRCERKKALSRAPGPSARLWETPQGSKGI